MTMEYTIEVKNQLRVWNHINNHTEFHDVEDTAQAAELIRRLVIEQLADKSIIVNAFGLEQWQADKADWAEWYDDDERDIMQVVFPDDED